MATVYAAPYSPSAFGFAKYNIACGAVWTNHAFCVRIDTTTGDSSCRYASDVSDTYGSWVNCHRLNADPNDMNPW